MQTIYYKDEIGNFGDDLNELIWPQILPPDVLEVKAARRKWS
jgi:succinoglycan biosynthesis protein ExoV